MKFDRYIKKCDTWVACAYDGEEGTCAYEYPHERKVLYHYLYYGSAKVGKPFSNDYKILKGDGTLLNVKDLYMKHNVFCFLEKTSMWGFNTLKDGEDWDGRLLNQDFLKVNQQSVLVCLDGNPIVNDVKLRKYDYDELTIGKDYNIMLNSGVLALFTKVL